MPMINWNALWQQFLYDPKNPLLFNNGFFVWFFLLFIGCYYFLRKHQTARNWVTCLFSMFFFYKASGWFVGLVLVSAVVDYLLSNAIYREKNQTKKKLLLALSIVFNLGLLFSFKYTNFFLELSNNLLATKMNPLNILLPVGISFYTFENLSYTIDVYRGEFVPEKKFSNYLLFLSFFPKLVMGPIVRARDFIPQLHKPYEVTGNDFSKGFYLIVSGLFKKLIISDYLTLNFVDYVFDGPSLHTGLECLLAVYGYGIIIYCDFSGYSDVAIGMARWLGITIPPNFLSPYQSKSITEFWRRWHISLSSWLRDYLYIFWLGGNRGAAWATWIIPILFFIGTYFGLNHLLHLSPLLAGSITAGIVLLFVLPSVLSKEKKGISTGFNLLVTMLLGGFWHGASWNFIIWGAMHGIGLAVHKLWMQLTGRSLAAINNTRVYNILMAVVTFHFVCFAWIFFKAPDFDAATQMLQQITGNFSPETWLPLYENYKYVLWMMALGFVLHFIPDGFADVVARKLERAPLPVYLLLFAGFILIYAQLKSATPVMPIYLQF